MNKFAEIIIPERSKYPGDKNLPLYKNKFYFVNNTIEKIYSQNKTINDEKLTAQINPEEGYFIYDLITKNKFKKCLEVGMANGLSSLYICQALFEQKSSFENEDKNIKDENQKSSKAKDFYLISIDPYQSTQWKNAAVKHLESSKLQSYNTLIEELDAVALPEILSLVSKKKLELFDFIFIDGDHKFDYTLLDFMYSDMMLKIGGVIAIDDVRHENVKACMNYIDTNYKHFKKLKGVNASKTMNLYIKIEEDKRNWDFHVPFKG